MPLLRRAVTLAACVFAATAAAQPAAQPTITTDRFVAHVSTVPANAGERVGLYLREKLSRETAAAIASGEAPDGRVVLFVHGVSVPSVPDFDLDFGDYSWMSYLATAGFDTFAMDHTGYGYSPRPAMGNPCNLDEGDRRELDPAVVPASCIADYGVELTSSATDWDEIDTIVDYIRELRGVDRVSLIGWSLGGLRAGGYAARHPGKVDRLVLFAPFFQPNGADGSPAEFPVPGAPMSLQTRDALIEGRWFANVACENQVEPGIAERVWQTIMAFDDQGSIWAPGGVMRVRSASYFGWNTASAGEFRVGFGGVAAE
jgi:pimeloyl-ACP methyl ester carboxylesterase